KLQTEGYGSLTWTLVVTRYHICTVYFYKPNGSSNFFDTKVLKESLGKILVPFYPLAGRLGYDENGRLEIICNAKGVLFIEAETTSIMDDLVKEFKDDSEVSTQHTLVDGSSGLHFINSWANIVRGCSPNIAPFLDRTLLRARHPPIPKFCHIEFEPSPSLQIMISTSKSQLCPKPSIVSVFTITTDKLNALKVKVNENSNSNTKYSTYSILTAHIWRCATKARDLLEDQQLKLNMPVDGRNRLQPPLPPGYIGNVIFMAALVALAGELLSKSFIDTVKRIHKILRNFCFFTN
ncbi:hypothetical protein QQP08_018098, partial [Theobroma cacao]